jgi:HEAT repeat protein
MAVRDIERELESLANLRSESPEACARGLRKALRDKVNLIVAKAAALTAEMQLTMLMPELCAAFDRLLMDPVKTDPKCWGKEAIVKALKDLGWADSAIFLKGAQHVQLEPVWGGEEDSAATLRATCTLALLQCKDLTREDKLWPVVRLLTERSAALRKDAALALESIAGREAALLLRIKARMGDVDPTVIGQVFESLLRVERESAVPFVLEFLRAPTVEVREEATLALGTSRLPAAVTALIDTMAQKHPLVDYDVLLRGLSISRHEQAVGFLLEMVRTRRVGEAAAALAALQLYRESSDIRNKIAEAVAARSEPEIHQEYHRFFQNTS